VSDAIKDLRKEIERIEIALDRAKIDVDAVCEAIALKDSEIERLSARVDELQEKCDYLEEGQ
jgi:hypothetical protein